MGLLNDIDDAAKNAQREAELKKKAEEERQAEAEQKAKEEAEHAKNRAEQGTI